MATATAPVSAAAAAHRKKCRKRSWHMRPSRRKVQAGSAGHLGPVGSSVGCSDAKVQASNGIVFFFPLWLGRLGAPEPDYLSNSKSTRKRQKNLCI